MNLRLTTFAAALLAGLPAAKAVTYNWAGNSAGWNDLNQWLEATVPTSASTTDLIFGSAGGYTSTNDIGPFTLNSLTLNTTTASTISGTNLSFVIDGGTAPSITQNGAGAFSIAAPVDATNALTFNGTGTGLVTLSGIISGGGGLNFAGGSWRLSNAANLFTGGLTVNTNATLELAPGGAVNIVPAATSIVGSNGAANVITINGGTLKVTTAAGGAITWGDNRALTFGANGGTLDVRNTAGGNTATGGNDFALTLNNAPGSPAVLKFNGGQNALNSNALNNGNWTGDGNSIRVESYAGTGPVRFELENGSTMESRAASVPVPVTIRGVVGGDPTGGPNATINANVSLVTGRLMLNNQNVFNYTAGLTFLGAMQVSPTGNTRALDGNITVGNGGYVAFAGRGTGTALGAAINNPGTATAGINPLWLGQAGNDILTIQNGGIAVFDTRIRHEQVNNNGVLLNARAIIQGGGELRIWQSLSRATAAAMTATQTGTNSTTSVSGFNIIDGNIEGQGSTASEAVLNIALPANPQSAVDTNADQVPDSIFGDLGGAVFRTTSNIVVNGTGFGGLRINTIARPNNLFAGATADPVSNLSKMQDHMTDARLAAVTGSGGYLTLAPAGATYSLNPGAVWSSPNVGLKVVDHNPAGVDVSLGAIASWANNLAVDVGATLDFGAQNPFFMPGPGALNGKGTVSGTGSLIVDAASSISPGLGDVGTLSIGMPLILGGGLSIGVSAATADRISVTGALTLGGPLALSGTFGTSDLTIASYSGALSGTFGSITGLSPDFTLDYGAGNNSVISLKYTAVATLVWNGNVSANWDTTTANWQGGGLFANGGKVLFDQTAAGPNFAITVSGGNVSPSLVTVNNTSTPYSITSSPGAAIIGSGKIVKNGSGLLTLSGPAAYIGGTEINGGELRLGNPNSLPDIGAVSVASGATLNIQGNSDTIGDLSVDGSVIGTGTLTIGALSLGGGGSVATNVSLGGDVTKSGAAGATIAGSVNLNGARAFNVAAGVAPELTVSGPISNGALTKTGNGTLVLSNAGNSQTSTTVSAGVLTSLGGIPAGSPVIVASGATLNLTHGTTTAFSTLSNSGALTVTDAQPLTIAELNGSGSINGANGITLIQSTVTTYSGSISGVTSVNMNGTGTITLSGNSSYSGGLFANNGRTVIASGNGGGSGIVTLPSGGRLGISAPIGNRIDLAGGTLFAIAAPASLTNNDLVATTGTTSTISLSDPNAPATLSETILLGTLKGSGDINVVISGQNSPDGGVGFRLRGTQASTYAGTITLGQGVKGEVQTTVAGPFSPAGNGKIVLTGGTFTSGTLNGNYSVLNVRNNSPGNTVIGNDIILTGTGHGMVNMPGSSPVGSITQMGSLTIGNGQAFGVYRNAGNQQIGFFPTVTLTGGTATLAPTPFGFTASGVADMWLGAISETVAGSSIVVDGTSTLSLVGTNNYSGSTRIEHGTVLAGALGALPLTTDLTVNGGTLDLTHPTTGGYDQIVNSLAGAGGTVTSSDAALHSLIVNQNTTTTFSGSLSGNISLDKQGNGTLTLAGTNSHTAPTLATVGTLLINGNNGFGPVIVGGGGTLGGTGITGPVNVGTSGILAPGSGGPGVLNTGPVTFSANAIFSIELNGAAAGTGYDQLNVTGDVSIGANTALTLSLGYNPVDNVDTFILILNDGVDPVTGTFAGLANNAAFSSGGQAFVISYFDDALTPGVEFSGGNDVTLQAIPEPGAAALLLGGISLLAARRRRVG